MPLPQQLVGKFAWFELVTPDIRQAQTFYSEVIGWRMKSFATSAGDADMIFTGDGPDTMIGNVTQAGDGESSRWIGYVSVADVARAAQVAVDAGGRVTQPPTEIPGGGWRARIADPQGAELGLLRRSAGDPPDVPARHGHWLWHELHTPDPAPALAFYAQVVGFTHEPRDMGPGGTYHILSGAGVGRGGVTHELSNGVPAYWLPYVTVDDPDATIAKARRLGATIPIAVEDIPGIGRFGMFHDRSGAALAVMRPAPM